jgi:peptidoglycan hydrolase-like protein with peptidoglycan-binding domain
VDDKPKTGNPYSEPTKNVRYNSRGNDARWLQYELNRYGYKLLVDGIIGQRSIDALKDFQEKHPPLVADGICGPKTKQALLG